MNVVYKTKKKEAIPELILPKVDGNRSVNLEIKKKFPYSIAILSQTSTFHIIVDIYIYHKVITLIIFGQRMTPKYYS